MTDSLCLDVALPEERSYPSPAAAQAAVGAAMARPPQWEERLASSLFAALAPRLARVPPIDPPFRLLPYERLEIERSGGEGWLSACWFKAAKPPRGAVLLVHPWLAVGQAYFHRRCRLEALRAAGYHALTFDLGGVGTSGPRRAGFYDRDVADALAVLRRRAAGLPLHVWGVSSGGYWAHSVLSREPGVSGAVFEDVPFHLIEWSKRMQPWGLPFYLFFQHGLRRAYRFLDLRRHAASLQVRAAAYVSGAADGGVLPADTRELAALARGEALVVPEAGHLEPIKRAGDEVIDFALATFERAGS